MKVVVNEMGANNLDRATKLLAGIEDGIFRASYSALNRAGKTAKTRAGTYAAEDYTIRKGDFMRNVKEKTRIESQGGSVSMSIIYAGNVLPLMIFDTNYSRTGHVQTRVKRSGAKTLLDNAFAARPFGGLGIFERLTDKRFPIEQKYGPSTAHMLQNEDVIEKMDETIRETFDKRLDHEVTRILNGWGGR